MPESSLSPKKKIAINFEPVGRRVNVEAGSTLLSAAQSAGVGLISICGGDGTCDGCRVRLVSGELSPHSLAEKESLNPEERASGLRLACQAKVLTDALISLPPESLTSPQRLQLEGLDISVKPNPSVLPIEVKIPPPTLHDLRADTTRLIDALNEQEIQSPSLGYPILTDLSMRLRELDWSARIACRGDQVVEILPLDTGLLGLAVDIGTTKLAAYLVDLTSGKTLSSRGAMNPQLSYGEDVVSRIVYADRESNGRAVLQEKLVETLNKLIQELTAAAGVSPRQIVDAVIVGNTAMSHLFAGLPVHQLGASPYVPAVSESLDVPAYDLSLSIARDAQIYLPPVIAGFVGADHLAMLLAAGIHQTDKTVIALDIGTNTEISLAANGKLFTCSCASGPAFEGAHIKHGMRAAPGAIERVQILGEEIQLYTIDEQPPVGICGSGILDAVAELLEAGAINPNGSMAKDHPLVRTKENETYVVLVESEDSGTGREVIVSLKDIREIQLAKAAIRSGIELLLMEAGLAHEDLDEFIIAGAFGTYLSTQSAVRVGMFPDLHPDRFRQIGNAAGIGAKMMLASTDYRRMAINLIERIQYIELSAHPQFEERFLQATQF